MQFKEPIKTRALGATRTGTVHKTYCTNKKNKFTFAIQLDRLNLLTCYGEIVDQPNGYPFLN